MKLPSAVIQDLLMNIQSFSLHKLRKINSAHATDINITIPLSISSYMQGLSRNSRSLSLPSKQLSLPSFAFPRESYSCSRFPATSHSPADSLPLVLLPTRLLLFPFPLENYKYFFSFALSYSQ